MIFFSIPSVGQIKPETSFGNDDHYGFIQTLIGDKYIRNEIKNKCKVYYDKPSLKYWDQIITLINFMGLKKLSEKNEFTNIPVLDFIANQFDQNNNLPSKILFDYLLSKWQHPHPILTHNRTGGDENLDLKWEKQRVNYPITKPYGLILSILQYFYNLNPNEAYLLNDEFYWIGYQHHLNKGNGFQLENTEELALQILKIRQNGGWKLYEKIKDKTGTSTHLSYPKGFLKNSFVLTDENIFYEKKENFFIGLKPVSNLNEKLSSLIDSCDSVFEFDRNKSERDSGLGFRYSEYLYSLNNINKWIENVKIYSNSNGIFETVNDNTIDFDEEKFIKLRTEFLLNRIDVLDKKTITSRRTEQHILRNYLIKNKNSGKCAICNKDYPVKFLATAHIKKRKNCSNTEKKDLNIVMPACYLGCDKLYENGYIVVDSGTVKLNTKNKKITNDLEEYLYSINNQKSYFYKNETKKYFDYHFKKNYNK